MTHVQSGGFAYLPDTGRSFSKGVVALEGYVLRRIQLQQLLPMETGLNLAADIIRSAGRPLTAFCGCELRIPQPLTRTDFSASNRRYIAALQSSGFSTEPLNPAARTNMAPSSHPPEDASLAAFTFAVPGSSHAICADFLVSGKPELASDPDRVIAPGDSSLAGLQEKAIYVLGELQRTVRQLGAQWGNITAAQIYTRSSLGVLEDAFASAGLPLALCTHVPGDPPVFGTSDTRLQFEVDVRSITIEETA